MVQFKEWRASGSASGALGDMTFGQTKTEKKTRTVSTLVGGLYRADSSAEEAEDGDEEEEEEMPDDLKDMSVEEQQAALRKRAFTGMTLGTVLVLIFSDPMTDMLGIIGSKADINPFYVSFVVAPLASNAAELVSSMKIAAKKTPGAMTQALATLEGAAIMNNSFCLSIFMLLIVWKQLLWQFSAETLSILLIEIVIGAIVLKFPVHTNLHGLAILACYPMAILVVYGFETFLKWD
jgi:Ca2+/Na+ antiporter